MNVREFAGRDELEGFADSHGFEGTIGGDQAVEFFEERPAVALVMLPGVFPVENDRHECVAAQGVDAAGVVANAIEEVRGGLGGLHARVDKADEVAQEVVAEEEPHRLPVLIPDPRAAGFVDPRSMAERGTEHAVVAGHPLDAALGRDSDGFVGDRAFRGPHAGGAEAEAGLGVVERGLNLVAGVLGIAEAARQRHVGMGDGSDIGIAQQRQDGVVERRDRNLDLAALGEAGVSGHHEAADFGLLAAHQRLVGGGEVAALVHQGLHVGIGFQEDLVEPG